MLVERILRRWLADDPRDAAEERLRLYEENTQPLLSLFEQRGIIHLINGHQPIEAVTADIITVLAAIFAGSGA